MSNQLEEKKLRRTTPTGRPLQRVSYTTKQEKDGEWFKQNADYYIGQAAFPNGVTAPKRDLGMLYNVYNNQFPLEWFTHITDPLNAQNPQHKNYPAKIRPTGMLRTNIDLLLGEYPKRPFVYQVQNMGGDGYNSYTEKMAESLRTNLQEHFLASAQQSMSEAGHDFQQIPQEQAIELPESVKERFTASYKDNLAIRAQKWIKRAVREYHVRQKHLKMFKDWLIVGSSYSYKNIENGNFLYERVSPKELKFDKSPHFDMVEDGEWAVRRLLLTASDVVDKFYSHLSVQDHDKIDSFGSWSSPMAMYDYLNTAHSDNEVLQGRVPVYHVTFKGRKAIKYISYTDPLTGQPQEMSVDEDTPVDASMSVIKTEWVNEVYEVYRVGDDIYPVKQAIPVQRNEMNNFSSCKLPYNGRNYSDTHSNNISVLEMGLPYAIMYMIVNYMLEKTIAKNKGKIAIIDQNAIPKGEGWDEEKFFYYGDALGYALLNRNQLGVDKSWNQYHVLDLSLWDQIKEMIMLRDSFINDWDRVLGINDQRKAMIGSSDGLGTTQTALFQSSVITDMIFTLFEEFIESDMQGILDYSKFVNVDGIRGIYNQDDFDRELLEIDPNSYCSAELGLFLTHSATEMQTLQAYKNQVQAMIQNGVKQSTILEIQQANNTAELMTKLRRLESIEMEQAQANAESEQQHELAVQEIKNKYLQLQSMLKIDEINAEYDRKESLEMVKGEYTLAGTATGDTDSDNNGVADAADISKRVIAQQQILSTERQKNMDLNLKNKIHQDIMTLEDKKLKLEREKLASKEKTEKMKNATARIKKKTTSK